MFDFSYTEVTTPSLEGLIQFCEKTPHARYSYMAVDGGCLLGQYTRYLNMKRPLWQRIIGWRRVTWQHLNWPNLCGSHPDAWMFYKVAVQQPWTFGAAADRCRRLLAERG